MSPLLETIIAVVLAVAVLMVIIFFMRADKESENESFKHWADLRNLQIAASSYANTGSISELNIEIDLLKDKLKQNRSSIDTFFYYSSKIRLLSLY